MLIVGEDFALRECTYKERIRSPLPIVRITQRKRALS